MSWWRRLFGRKATPAPPPTVQDPWFERANSLDVSEISHFLLAMTPLEPSKRVALLRRCRERFGDHPDICLPLARLDPEEAPALWQTLISHYPAEAHGALAEFALTDGDRAEAARQTQRALAADPSNSAVLDRALSLRDALPQLPNVAAATIAPVALHAAPTTDRIPDGITLGERLGSGGFGVVYGATDSLGRAVAIKFLHLHHLNNPAHKMAFITEARTLARLDHPRIVTIYDLDPERGTITMKRCEGSLQNRLDAGARFPDDQISQDIAQILATLHALDCIHGDLKPANILFDQHARPVLSDFGLGAAGIGTVGWRAPEQGRGQARTSAVDVYAFGRLLDTLGHHPELAKTCQVESPTERPSMTEIVVSQLE